ncbi:MAG: hypothetical protein COT14_00685 [Candidatus Diapherotrites archaeon CG08_land_8_20_14_0_20_30_16]|nr:MAG: hypothetical protein COT14_00685 [Candidatus Diapherotrites archaeon CG08_land_8_20_14_0_20_30_16]
MIRPKKPRELIKRKRGRPSFFGVAKTRLETDGKMRQLNELVIHLRQLNESVVIYLLKAKLNAIKLKKKGFLRRDLKAVGLSNRELRLLGFTLEDYIDELLLQYPCSTGLLSTFDLTEFYGEGFTKEELEKSNKFGVFFKNYFDLSEALRFGFSKEFIKNWFGK